MTPLPKRRLSRQRQGKRRSAIRLLMPVLTKCPNCGNQKRDHVSCPSCGKYNGRQTIAQKEKPQKADNT